MVDTLEAMVGSVVEQAEAGRDVASTTTDTKSAAEPLPRTQPPVSGPIMGPGPSTSSSGVRDSVMSGILGQGVVGASVIKWEPTGSAETKMGGTEGILLDAE